MDNLCPVCGCDEPRPVEDALRAEVERLRAALEDAVGTIQLIAYCGDEFGDKAKDFLADNGYQPLDVKP